MAMALLTCLYRARAGGGELHNISSLAGGLVAQEVIKVITKQYIPVDNTCVFDGIKSVASVLKL
jgi:amyloid beta precursor protein binding protein 1